MLAAALAPAPTAAARPSRRVAGARRRSPATVRVSAANNPAGSDKYDYIIVGGGTAGCVLANRLTAQGDKHVLVLEAGGPGGALETIPPAGLSRTFLHPRLDWALYSSPQATLGMAGPREVYLARGRTLGGSSATNATLYLRGSAADYDGWGLDGWGAADVLPWFVASENNASFSTGPYHGKTGPMNVDRPRYQNPLFEAFYSSARGAGLAPCDDFNDWSHAQDGFGEYQVTHLNGRRADAFQTYLKPVIGRGNLKVVTGARATKIHWLKKAAAAGAGGGGSSSGSGSSSSSSGQEPRAGGVEFAVAPDLRYQTTPGQARPATFTAELAPGGEVLMCGGAVATPQLLMLSGVGAQAELSAAGIGGGGAQGEGAGVESPHVGKNLQDHPATLVTSAFQERFRQLCLTHGIYGDGFRVRASAIAQLLFLGKGPLATTGCDRGAFVRTTPDKAQPDLQIRFAPAYALDPDAIQSYIRFGKLAAEGKAWPGGATLQLLATRPKSRGCVSLASADPFAAPKVDLGYFTDAKGEDLATLVAGVRLARRIAEQPALAQYVESESWPGEGVKDGSAELEEYVRRTAVSGNAVVGSCRMGATPADSAVSASDFGVWGVEGVRVVDASLLPVIPGGQTGAPVVMAAERAAALLVDGTPLSRGGGGGGSAGRGVAPSSSSSSSPPREPALV